jgi:hypothetical protein
MSTRRSLSVVVFALVIAACSPAEIVPLLPGSTPFVTVTTRGGHCLDGPCGSTIVVERDGRLHQTAPEDAILGQVPPEVLGALDAGIQGADFTAIRARPFTGECPVSYDGQEIIYEFSTPAGVERIASCETEIDPDAPLFRAVTDALAAAEAV